MKCNSTLIILTFCLSFVNAQWYVSFGDFVSAFLDLTGIPSPPLYPQPLLESKTIYDFIIVGSGPSGSALAARLTEDPNVSVLLLEDGEEPGQLTDVPILAGYFGFTKYSYGYRTEPQGQFCKGCIDRKIYWIRGKALGGSTIINYMVWSRGNRRDYDTWANMGNPGWSYDDLLPYFKKIENVTAKMIDKEYRGFDGYVTVSDIPFRTNISDIFVQTCLDAGYDYVDYNAKEQIGVSFLQSNLVDGKRCSAEKAYLRPFRNRPNLTILTGSKATKILIDKNGVAYGVQYIRLGLTRTAYARKEVISSAGALNSPQLLMLSGLGPRDQLEPLGIPVIKDLPVGKKVYDHAAFQLLVYEVNQSLTMTIEPQVFLPKTYSDFLGDGKGLFTSTGGIEALVFKNTNVSTNSDPMYPDVEFLFTGGSVVTDRGVCSRKLMNMPPETYDTMYSSQEEKNTFTPTVILLRPNSFGSIRLKTKNPLDPPLFYANFLSDPKNEDVKIFIAGIRELQRIIGESETMRKCNATMITTPVPGCENETFDSDDYWECAIRSIISTYWHMMTSCKMGPRNDTEAVVDNELRVYGVKNLRVVDSSVIPLPLTSHNQAPTYVIGEKAADLIKSYWYR